MAGMLSGLLTFVHLEQSLIPNMQQVTYLIIQIIKVTENA